VSISKCPAEPEQSGARKIFHNIKRKLSLSAGKLNKLVVITKT
jgi:hypothetical protein